MYIRSSRDIVFLHVFLRLILMPNKLASSSYSSSSSLLSKSTKTRTRTFLQLTGQNLFKLIIIIYTTRKRNKKLYQHHHYRYDDFCFTEYMIKWYFHFKCFKLFGSFLSKKFIYIPNVEIFISSFLNIGIKFDVVQHHLLLPQHIFSFSGSPYHC